MKLYLLARIAVALVACTMVACFTPGKPEPVTPPNGGAPAAATLRVALFPYIPDSGQDEYKSLTKYVEDGFEQMYPTVDLVLRPLNPEDDFYDPNTLAQWLSPEAQDGYDVVEVDTVILGDLVSSGLIAPWRLPPSPSDWHPVAASSVRLNDVVYGVPHLLCGHFLMTRNKAAAEAKNVEELAIALRSVSNQHPELAGNMVGSWNLPSLYLDAWEDANAGSSTAYALHQTLDNKALDSFKKFSSLCQSGGVNPCLNGTYDDYKQPTLAADKFARGEADALFGYSERLFFVLTTATDDSAILITSAPMGNGKYPVLFTDAFVLRRGAPANVEEAARLFAAFMNSQKVQEAIVTSGDVSAQAVPRYLIPATLSAFDAPRLKNDQFFKALRGSISNAVPFPNVGFLNTRKAVRDEVKSFLEQP